jgi:hypothetical protein
MTKATDIVASSADATYYTSVSPPSFPLRGHQSLRVAYFRFSISYRDVEEMMAKRGLTLTYETIRRWCLKVDDFVSS